MTIALSHDQHEAVKNNGTPLPLIDSSTGERYVLLPEATFAKAQSLLCAEEAVSRLQIPNAKLLELAKMSPPPARWLDSDEEDLF